MTLEQIEVAENSIEEVSYELTTLGKQLKGESTEFLVEFLILFQVGRKN